MNNLKQHEEMFEKLKGECWERVKRRADEKR